MRALLFACLSLFLAGCQLDSIGLKLAPGWQLQSLIVWRGAHPEDMAISRQGRWLYISCRTPAHHNAPSLAAYDLQREHKLVLITGLQHASGMALAPDGSLWLGEDYDRGMIWRIAEPDRLPPELFLDRERPEDAPPAISRLAVAGVFAHAAIAFAGNHVYLADATDGGALYRMHLDTHRLEVLHAQRGWLTIEIPEQARSNAQALGARAFQRITDIEPLPDGRMLLAEQDGGRIWLLDDRAGHPRLQPYLSDTRIRRPLHLAWDASRRWLWLSDGEMPSSLWLWDGHGLTRIAHHDKATISGVLVHGDDVLIHLQNRERGPELTLRLRAGGDETGN